VGSLKVPYRMNPQTVTFTSDMPLTELVVRLLKCKQTGGAVLIAIAN